MEIVQTDVTSGLEKVPSEFLETSNTRFQRSLKWLAVTDVGTQLSLFQYVWKWTGEKNTEGVDSLIKTFGKFAHSIDNSGGSNLKRVRFQDGEQKMEMYTESEASLRAIIFIDITNWHYSAEILTEAKFFLKQILNRFYKLYSGTLDNEIFQSSLKNIARDISRQTVGLRTQADMMGTFSMFKVIVNEVISAGGVDDEEASALTCAVTDKEPVSSHHHSTISEIVLEA